MYRAPDRGTHRERVFAAHARPGTTFGIPGRSYDLDASAMDTPVRIIVCTTLRMIMMHSRRQLRGLRYMSLILTVLLMSSPGRARAQGDLAIDVALRRDINLRTFGAVRIRIRHVNQKDRAAQSFRCGQAPWKSCRWSRQRFPRCA